MRWRGWTGAAVLALAIAGCGSIDMVSADEQGQEHVTEPDAGAPTSAPATGGTMGAGGSMATPPPGTGGTMGTGGSTATPPPATGGTTGAGKDDEGDDGDKPTPGKGGAGMKGPKS